MSLDDPSMVLFDGNGNSISLENLRERLLAQASQKSSVSREAKPKAVRIRADSASPASSRERPPLAAGASRPWDIKPETTRFTARFKGVQWPSAQPLRGLQLKSTASAVIQKMTTNIPAKDKDSFPPLVNVRLHRTRRDQSEFNLDIEAPADSKLRKALETALGVDNVVDYSAPPFHFKVFGISYAMTDEALKTALEFYSVQYDKAGICRNPDTGEHTGRAFLEVSPAKLPSLQNLPKKLYGRSIKLMKRVRNSADFCTRCYCTGHRRRQCDRAEVCEHCGKAPDKDAKRQDHRCKPAPCLLCKSTSHTSRRCPKTRAEYKPVEIFVKQPPPDASQFVFNLAGHSVPPAVLPEVRPHIDDPGAGEDEDGDAIMGDELKEHKDAKEGKLNEPPIEKKADSSIAKPASPPKPNWSDVVARRSAQRLEDPSLAAFRAENKMLHDRVNEAVRQIDEMRKSILAPETITALCDLPKMMFNLTARLEALSSRLDAMEAALRPNKRQKRDSSADAAAPAGPSQPQQ
jgi:hypothetical protein